MPTIDLLHFAGCPNVERTRANLRAALGETGLSEAWNEFTTDAVDLPVYARGYGSPTILVNGREILGASPSDSPAVCRLYPSGFGDHGAPAVSVIVAALRGAGASREVTQPRSCCDGARL